MKASVAELDRLLAAIRACRYCVETPSGASLPHEPRPVLRASTTARLAVCSQAPGTRVHKSGTPFTDASGDRLRDWMGVSPQEFYDETRVAIIPMGFCFPGQDANGGDLPPRAECAKLWHQNLFAALPQLDLVLAVGSYAQAGHLGEAAGASLQETMLAWREHLNRKRRPRSCRCRIPLGATMAGSSAIRGSRRSCCRCSGAKSGRASEFSLLHFPK